MSQIMGILIAYFDEGAEEIPARLLKTEAFLY